MSKANIVSSPKVYVEIRRNIFFVGCKVTENLLQPSGKSERILEIATFSSLWSRKPLKTKYSANRLGNNGE